MRHPKTRTATLGKTDAEDKRPAYFDRFRFANWPRWVWWTLAGGIALIWWVDLQTIPQPTMYRAFVASMSRVLSLGVLAFALYLATRPLPGHIRQAVVCPGRTLLLRLPDDGGIVRIRVTGMPLILGRAGDCDVLIDAAHVSAKHCRVWAEEGKVLVQDLGSTNGTWVGNDRLGDTPVTMTSNLQFLLGGISDGLSLSLEDQ